MEVREQGYLIHSINGTGLTGRKNVATLSTSIAGFFTVHEYIIVLFFDGIGGNYHTFNLFLLPSIPLSSSPPPLRRLFSPAQNSPMTMSW